MMLNMKPLFHNFSSYSLSSSDLSSLVAMSIGAILLSYKSCYKSAVLFHESISSDSKARQPMNQSYTYYYTVVIVRLKDELGLHGQPMDCGRAFVVDMALCRRLGRG